LADTLKANEMFDFNNTQLLTLLYHEQTVHLYEPCPVQFKCSCSREKCLHILQNFDKTELEEQLQEMGKIEMDCHFCGKIYTFTKEDIL
jgi:molecular chaperone Hsp33